MEITKKLEFQINKELSILVTISSYVIRNKIYVEHLLLRNSNTLLYVTI